MNKFLLTVGLLLAAPAAFAQAGFRFGPQLGFNYAGSNYAFPDITSSDKSSNSYRPGLEAGAQVQFDLAAHYALQSGLLFSQKGAHVENSYFTAYSSYTYTYTETYDFRFNYLVLPLRLQYSSAPNGQGLLLLAGTYAGFLGGGSYKSTSQAYTSGTFQGGGGDSGNVAPGDTYNTNYSSHTYYSRGLDAGGQLGMGVGGQHLQVQLVYSYGLRNLGAEYPAGKGRAAPSYHNRCFTLAAAYLFGSSK
ncbi:porin family protein [Hymenobacter sp. H14-R3]|uniref:porin family protein n=1 Tax=Hymenobacter sp. H14-R3 TaxID=3046308 RepID=UPI0024B92824|nr:porin family protein [Hymenobacter sp. H14-R3]MDJ0366067.1 porin family protein [Hymenobacter sp. H14-R3]